MTKQLLIILWLLPILFEIGRNYYIIRIKKRPPTYIYNNLIKLGFFGIFQGMAGFSITYGLYQFVCFGALFDPCLNLIRGKAISYVNRSPEASLTDKVAVFVEEKFGFAIPMQMFTELIIAQLAMALYYAEWVGFKAMVNGTYNWDNWLW